MDPTALVALITSGAALMAALAALRARPASPGPRAEAAHGMARYQDPLLWAAVDLRGRLDDIMANGFLGSRREQGGKDWEYAQNHTLYLVAQHLCWTEVTRRGVHLLDLGKDDRNRRIVQLGHEITRSFAAASARPADAAFRLWQGEQRAIGELMITTTAMSDGELGCLGYAAFCARLEDDEQFARWFQDLLVGVADLAARADARTERLMAVRRGLTVLIDFLDPDAVRCPARHRDRLTGRDRPSATRLTDRQPSS